MQFPINGGHMGQAIREFDWSATSLGPAEHWPISLRSIVQTMLHQGHAISIFWGDDLTMLYNDAYRPFLGTKEHRALGVAFSVIWSDIWDDVQWFVNEALGGRGTYSQDLPLIMNRNGYPEETFWTFSYSPLHDDQGVVRGIMNVTIETTSLVASRREEAALRRELTHRMKNSMAVTAAVISATMRHATSLDQARDTISQRLTALANAQNLLYRPEGKTSVKDVIVESIAAHIDDQDRLHLTGPSVFVSPQQSVGLSLAIYELATNALKYGALSNEIGQIEISWTISDEDEFQLIWTESGGPEVVVPTTAGFGSRLTNRIVAGYFRGTGETDYRLDGVVFKLRGQLRTEDDH